MKRPNILHIMGDQHQANCVGLHGREPAITPHLDRLAREGSFFSNAYCQNPICTPSRVSILSGQYPMNHGYYGIEGPTPENLTSFFEHFGQNGYRTALIGKLHFPNDPVDWQLGKVDHWADFLYDGNRSRDGAPYLRHLRAKGLDGIADYLRLPEFPGKQQHEGRPSNLDFEDSMEGWCVQESLRFLREESDRPFCMHVSFSLPHQTYVPAKQFWDLYPEDLGPPPTLHQSPEGRPPHFKQKVEDLKTHEWLIEPKEFEAGSARVWRAYLAAISHVDHAVGLLLEELERMGELDNTIVVYHSDHGAYSGSLGVMEKAPGICSDLVCRVPLYMRVPGAKPGQVVEEPVENIDLAPTLCRLCELPPLEAHDGCDLSPLLEGRRQPVKEVAVTEHAWSKAIRWGKWRYVHYQPEMFPGEERWGELYDLDADPGETRNLFFDPGHQAVVHDGRLRLLEWTIRHHRMTGLPNGTKGKTETAESGRVSLRGVEINPNYT